MDSKFGRSSRMGVQMSHIVTRQIVEKNSVIHAYLAPAEPPIGRSAVLTRVIYFEDEFQLYLFEALKKINPNISEAELQDKGIFSEPNMLSSLSKCVRFAKVLDLVNEDEFFDIKKLVTLRNMYAHGKHRTDLKDDEDAQAVMRSMKMYANSKADLELLPAGKAFFCCIDQLSEIIQTKRAGLAPG
jgi:hypothetical protein